MLLLPARKLSPVAHDQLSNKMLGVTWNDPLLSSVEPRLICLTTHSTDSTLYYGAMHTLIATQFHPQHRRSHRIDRGVNPPSNNFGLGIRSIAKIRRDIHSIFFAQLHSHCVLK